MFTVALKILCIAIIVKNTEADFFSAIADIDPLLDTHKNVIHIIEYYLYEEGLRLNNINNLLNNYKKNHEIMEKDPDYIGNPLNAFTLIKRLTADLHLVQYFANSALSTLNPSVIPLLPTSEDLEGAAAALLRIQNTYKLNVTHLSQGVLQGTYSHEKKPYVEKISPLSASDLFELGKRAYVETNFKNAIDWLMEALSKLKNKPPDEIAGIVEADVIDWIRMSYHWMGDIKNAFLWTEELLTLRPDYKDAKDQMAEYENQLIQNELLEDSQNVAFHSKRSQFEGYHQPPFNPNMQDFYNLCRGENTLPAYVTKNLYCYYKSGPEPFLKLARIKAELMYDEPKILLFHDVISDEEIETLQEMAKKKSLQRSTVNTQHKNGTYYVASYRICKTAWFSDHTSEVAARVSQRVRDFTELSLETAEPLQLANYGIGGHYEAHYDFLRDQDKAPPEIGDRIATVLFYMSDVEQGGATTFTEFDLTVFPVRNSALFWMNLLPDGEPDLRTRHGACPVLRGSKWVCNKWIRIGGNEFKRPCPLKQ